MGYKVLIADDEVWARKGLKKMIRWDELGLNFAGEANDGKEALRLILEQKPDILISDVRMPSIDGLSLSEELLKHFPDMKIIIVSGYDEFEYIKRAMDLNAINYILKPVDKTELNDMLKKAIALIERDRKEEEFKNNIPLIIEKLLNDVLSNQNVQSISKIKELIKNSGFQGEEYCIAIFQTNRPCPNMPDIKSLISKITLDICDDGFHVIVFQKENNQLGLLIIKKKKEKLIDAFLKRLDAELEKENIIDYCIGVGKTCDSLNEIFESYCYARDALINRAAGDDSRILYFSKKAVNSKRIFPVELQKKFITYVELNDKNNINMMLREIQKYFLSSNEWTIQEIQQFFFLLVGDMVRNLQEKRHTEKSIVEEGFKFCNEVYNYNTFDELRNWVRNYSLKVAEVLCQGAGENLNCLINKIVEYIRNNYKDDLNLNTISKMFGINPCYLSTVFKEKTGENFIDFIIRVRMEKAKEFLENSNAQVQYISKLVGYDDSRYFSKIFRNYTGMTPTQYRQEVQK